MIHKWPFDILPPSVPLIKESLNYNPWHSAYTKGQSVLGRNPNETDRGGWRGYDRVYSHYLKDKLDDDLKLLEIGIHSGYGLLAWCNIFKNSKVYGMENNDSFMHLYEKIRSQHKNYANVDFNFGDSRESSTWSVYNKESFDIIIDDGSHEPGDQIKTLGVGFEYLKPGGFYFIEDISKRYYLNKTCDDVFYELKRLRSDGCYVTVYSHKNEGWERALKDKSLWRKFGITDSTPKIAEDYIAVIQKL